MEKWELEDKNWEIFSRVKFRIKTFGLSEISIETWISTDILFEKRR